METSFESILEDVFGIENYSYESSMTTESHMMYDDNYVKYSTEMVEVTALIAMESMISMESDGDNIIVRFFKFIGKIVSKIIEGIGRFFKWIGNVLGSIFGGKSEKMAKKQETVKTVAADYVKKIEKDDKKFKIMTVSDLIKVKSDNAVTDKVMRAMSVAIDGASKMNSKLDISNLDVISDMTSSLNEIKAAVSAKDSSDKNYEDNLKDEKSIRTNVIDTSVFLYLNGIDSYATNNKGELNGIKQMILSDKNDIKKLQNWLNSFNRSIDTGLKISEKLEIKNQTNSYTALKELNRLIIEVCQDIIGGKGKTMNILLNNIKEVERINSYILKIAEFNGILSSDLVKNLDDSNNYLLAFDKTGTIHI